MATITKRGKSYRIRVSLGYDANNKQIVRTLTWKPPVNLSEKQIEKELRRQAVMFEEEVKASQTANGNIKFKDFCEMWFTDYAEQQLRHKTIQRYKSLKHRVYQGIGHIKISKLQPQHLLAFYNSLSEVGVKKSDLQVLTIDLSRLLADMNISLSHFCSVSGVSDTTLRSMRKGNAVSLKTARKVAAVLGTEVEEIFTPKYESETLSPQTIKHYHAFISSVLEKAVKWGYIIYNPCRRIDPPKVQKKEIVYLTKEQAVRMLALINKEPYPYRLIFNLLMFCGMRRGELMGLEWKDIDFKHAVLQINRTSQYSTERGTYTDDVKTKSSRRSIKIPDDLVNMLQDYKQWQENQRLAIGDRWIDTDRLFTQWNGLPMSLSAPYVWLKKFTTRNGLPNITLHGLRHTNATLLISEGVDIRTVAGRLGHSVASTTLNVYTHELKTADAMASDSLAEIFNNGGNNNEK